VSLVNGGEGAVEITGERGEGVHLGALEGNPPHCTCGFHSERPQC
jgi:hypothetical protein